MIHSCLTGFGDNSQDIVCTDVDGSGLRRVLGIECVSEAILSLFPDVVWLNADRMLDTKLVSLLFVDEFQAAVVTVSLREGPNFERDTLVMLEIVSLFEHVIDIEFECTPVFVPVERVEVVTDETVQFVAFFSVASIAR